jgi:hypothetical protein
VIAAIAGKTGSADRLAELVGLSGRLGSLTTMNLPVLVLFALLGYGLYRVGLRKQH